MRRLVFLTQQVDPGHPALAATIPKLRALAERVDELTVLADTAVPDVLPANVRVHEFGSPTKAGRSARFLAALAGELSPRPLAVVAHMAPIFAVLAAPLVRPRGIPLLLWFTHWHTSPTLRLAERLATRIVSVDSRSFPLASDKVVAIGHGIDLSEFECAPHHGGLHVLALGRYSEAKGLQTVIEAVARVPEATLEVRGPALNAAERAHRARLESLAGARVVLGDAVPRSEVPALFARADVLVNNMRAGSPDKAVYEACASCLPVLASNPVFDELLEPELRFAREDPGDLAAKLCAFAARRDRDELGRRLRERVAERHSVSTWAEGILKAAQA